MFNLSQNYTYRQMFNFIYFLSIVPLIWEWLYLSVNQQHGTLLQVTTCY